MSDPSGLLTLVGAVISIAVLVAFFLLLHRVGQIRRESVSQSKLLWLICAHLRGDDPVGKKAVAQCWMYPASPQGWVKLEGREWDSLGSGDIKPGSQVRVSGIRGLTLLVEPLEAPSAAGTANG